MKLKLYSARLGQDRKQCFEAGRAIARAQAALDEAILEGGTDLPASFNKKGVQEAIFEAGVQYRRLREALPEMKKDIDPELAAMAKIRQRLSVSPIRAEVPRMRRMIAKIQLDSVNLDEAAGERCRVT